MIVTILAAGIAVLGLPNGSAASLASAMAAPGTTLPISPSVDEPDPLTDPIPPVDEPVPGEPDDSLPGDSTDEPGSEDGSGAEDDDDTGANTTRVQPTVRTTTIAPASIVLAIVVLGAVVLAWRIGARRSGRHPAAAPHPDDARIQVPPPLAPQQAAPRPAAQDQLAARPAPADTTTLGFLLELGEALVDAGDAVHNVTSTLEGVARMNGKDGLGAIVLPTALILTVPGAGNETAEVTTAGRSRLRLDQIELLMNLVERAERGELSPDDGRRELRAIRSRPHPSSSAVQLAGSAVAAGGLALVLRGGVPEVALATALGALVGRMNLATASARYLYRPFWPLLASFVVAATTFTAVRLADIVAFPALVAPLITFLPGALLTIAVLELATGQILAGSSRLASGVFQLVLLALGIVAGAQVVGVPASAVGSVPEGPIAVAGPWAGVAVFGIGIVWTHGLRSTSIPWILVVLYVAYAGQVIGGVFVGSALSSFFGAVAMTPVAVLLARQGLGPPTLVTFFSGFWILVPGALGLEGVTRIIGNDSSAATGALITTTTSMIGIALGVLLGLALSAQDPERPWTGAGRLRRRATP